MKTIPAIAAGTLLSLATLLTPGAVAQTATPASAGTQPAAVAQSNLAGYSRVVYVATLPGVRDLLGSVPPGLTVERIETTTGQTAITYKNASGAFTQEAYVLLSQASIAPPPPIPATAVATVPVPTPAPALAAAPAQPVVYVQQQAPVTYYSGPGYDPGYYDQPDAFAYAVNPYPYDYPYPYFYPSVGFGFGFSGGGRFNGGFRGGGRSGSGGFHRR